MEPKKPFFVIQTWWGYSLFIMFVGFIGAVARAIVDSLKS